MYNANEIPKIDGSLFYYGYECPDFAPEKLLNILQSYGFFPSDYIRSPLLTNGRLRKMNDKFFLCIKNTFEDPNGEYLELIGAKSVPSDSYWEISWHPIEYSADGTVDRRWSIFSMKATYDLMEDSDFCQKFLNCYQELITVLHPFYGTIEDIDFRVRLSTNYHGSVVPMTYGKIRYVCWGNYFGSSYCKSYGLQRRFLKLRDKKHAPYIMKDIADGVFIMLTSSPIEYDSEECWKRRMKLVNNISV